MKSPETIPDTRIRRLSPLDRILNIRVDIIFLVAVLAMGTWFAIAFGWIAFSRLSYPFDLEWIEGGLLVNSYRLLHGQSMYPPPSADLIAFPYPPVWAAVVAAFGWISGLGLPVARAVGIAATLGVVALLVRTVLHETEDWKVASVAAGMFFALYPVTGYWFDLARVESLPLLLGLGMLYLARYHGDKRGAWIWLTAVSLLAFFTKQTAALFLPLAFLSLHTTKKRDAWRFAIATSALILALLTIAHLWTDGWYTYFVYKVFPSEAFVHENQIAFLQKLLKDVPLVLVGAAAWAITRVSGLRLRRLGGETWVLAPLVGALSGYLTWCRPGGYLNDFAFLYVFALIPAAMTLHQLWRSQRLAVPLLASVAVTLQFVALVRDPRPQLVTSEDRAAGQQVLELARRFPGPVLIPEHPWYAVLAGKSPSYHTYLAMDLRLANAKEVFPKDLIERLTSESYDAVITAFLPEGGSYPPELLQHYRWTATIRYAGSAFEGKTGWGPARPLNVLCPVAPSWQALGLTRDFEAGDYRGWIAVGDAFGEHPSTGVYPGQQPISGFVGRYFVNSFAGGSDLPTGELVTRWFHLNADRISFKVGGSADGANVGVQLWTEAGLARRAAGHNTEHLEDASWDVRDLRGKIVQLRVVDESSGAWGHVLFDDLRFD